ncbi:MAG: GNAT family N-acetyltransferase [Pseudomonadota bacterium]
MKSEPPVLHTPRCTLVLLQPDNAHLLLAYRQRNLDHLSPWEPTPNPDDGTLEEACQRAAAKSEKAFAEGVAVYFIATDPQTGAMLAACNFTNTVRGIFQACHLGYSVDHAWQGKGLVYEVVQAGITYMFETQGLHRIMANHMPANVRSEQLLRRLGFEREGYARAYLKIGGQWQDHVLNALVRPES